MQHFPSYSTNYCIHLLVHDGSGNDICLAAADTRLLKGVLSILYTAAHFWHVPQRCTSSVSTDVGNFQPNAHELVSHYLFNPSRQCQKRFLVLTCILICHRSYHISGSLPSALVQLLSLDCTTFFLIRFSVIMEKLQLSVFVDISFLLILYVDNRPG